METTVGQILLNEGLPDDMKDYTRVLDKKGMKALMQELADRYPDRYSEINHRIHNIAQGAMSTLGGVASISLASFKTPPAVKQIHAEMTEKIDKIINGSGDQKTKNEAIIQTVSGYIDRVQKVNYEEGLKENNPLAVQVLSGSRGNQTQFRSIRGGDLLVTDHKDRPVPIPILASYSEGLDPVQYWAGSYSARKGSVSTKFATPKSGFLGKQLAMASHRLVVTEKDCGTTFGIPVTASDNDNEGAVLARSAKGIDANTVLTPKMLKELGDAHVLVRSPITCQARHGVCQRCAGVRERGSFPPIGDNIGIAAAQAISEPIGQGQLSKKHGGGMAKGGPQSKNKSGLDLINQIVQVPETFQGAATIATTDGRVEMLEPAPQGGTYVTINKIQHWVPSDEELSIKKGDTVEAGDVLSSGIPNPSLVTKYKGIGEGRRYFMELFRDTLEKEGFKSHRRNVELLARGLVNHVRVTDPDGPEDAVPDDIMEYDHLARGYQPRFGFKMLSPKQAVGLHLEEPALHFSIGTRITPKVAKALEEFEVPTVKVHADEPSFVPEMTRAMETLTHSDDWMIRLGGFHLKKGLTEAVHRARVSDVHGTSFIPALAQGVEFGKAPEGKGY